ncbi:MAG: PQQ-binding-like beta-propeller repeat protein [Planctomycetaceae bacterium]
MAAAVIALGLVAPRISLAEETWTEFRGPGGQGHSAATGLPTQWDESTNIRWRCCIPGVGWSSPVVLNNRIYLTTAVPQSDTDGEKKEKAEETGQSLRALCVDAVSGSILWNEEVFRLETGPRAKLHNKNSHASPTPIIDGERLYVHFGTQGTACLTLDGKEIWKTREFVFQPQHGNGNSPIIVDDLLFVNCDGSDIQFVVALDKSTGQVRWKKPRPEADEIKKFSFATPLVIEVEGKKQIVSPAAHWVVAYNPADGEEIWRVRYHGYSLAPRPIYGHGLVFVCTGFDRPSLLAIRPDGTGDVTKTHVEWKTDRAAPNTPSPLLIGDELYVINDKGVATCFDARSGKTHWTQRIGGNFSASPIFADGKVYLESEDGETIVIRPGLKYEELGRNTLKARTLASFAIDGKGILLRTQNLLLRIEEMRQARGQGALSLD